MAAPGDDVILARRARSKRLEQRLATRRCGKLQSPATHWRQGLQLRRQVLQDPDYEEQVNTVPEHPQSDGCVWPASFRDHGQASLKPSSGAHLAPQRVRETDSARCVGAPFQGHNAPSAECGPKQDYQSNSERQHFAVLNMRSSSANRRLTARLAGPGDDVLLALKELAVVERLAMRRCEKLQSTYFNRPSIKASIAPALKTPEIVQNVPVRAMELDGATRRAQQLEAGTSERDRTICQQKTMLPLHRVSVSTNLTTSHVSFDSRESQNDRAVSPEPFVPFPCEIVAPFEKGAEAYCSASGHSSEAGHKNNTNAKLQSTDLSHGLPSTNKRLNRFDRIPNRM